MAGDTGRGVTAPAGARSHRSGGGSCCCCSHPLLMSPGWLRSPAGTRSPSWAGLAGGGCGDHGQSGGRKVGAAGRAHPSRDQGIHPDLCMILLEVCSRWFRECPVPAIQCQQPDRGPGGAVEGTLVSNKPQFTAWLWDGLGKAGALQEQLGVLLAVLLGLLAGSSHLSGDLSVPASHGIC